VGATLQITATAAAELGRQAAVAGTPGMMHLDLTEGHCESNVIRLQPGRLNGTPAARAEGVTLHVPDTQHQLLEGLTLDYRSDISGGGFLILSNDAVRCCACGSAFSRL
tara:strand:- start:14 stop:340 length:327 start_codon:yes stop_codon:yes gene_type:complete